MRIIILTLLLFFPVQVFAQDLPNWAEAQLNSAQDFQQSDFLSPSFFESDFNGDGENDIAMPVVNEDKFGIAFFLKNDSVFVAGAGKSFGPGGNDFSWADEWEIFDKEKTYQITFKENDDIDGEEEVLLENPAISIRQSEGSGGLIYFNGEKFVWIHQGG
jgi:hypothetical protein